MRATAHCNVASRSTIAG